MVEVGLAPHLIANSTLADESRGVLCDIQVAAAAVALAVWVVPTARGVSCDVEGGMGLPLFVGAGKCGQRLAEKGCAFSAFGFLWVL